MYLELLDVEDEGLAPRAWLEAAELAIEGKAPADLLKRSWGGSSPSLCHRLRPPG